MNQAEVFKISRQALEAMKIAVRQVLIEHKQHGWPIHVYRDGKVRRIPASKITIFRLKIGKKK
jgi:hypothetical protein